MCDKAKVVIPDNAVAEISGPDLLPPLQTLLQGLNLLGDKTANTNPTKPADPDDPGAQALESTATAMVRVAAPAVAGLGGLAAIGSAIGTFFGSSDDSVRVAAVASAAGVLVVVILGLAYIVGADLQSRSRSTVAIYEARRAIGVQFLQEALAASKEPGQPQTPAAAKDSAKPADAADAGVKPAADCASPASPPSPTSPSPSAAVVALAAAGAKAKITSISNQADGHLAGLRCGDKVEVRWVDGAGQGTWADPSDIKVGSFTF